MPTNKRKGRRGKQRKGDKAPINQNKKDCETVGSPSWQMMRQMMAEGCRVEFSDDGAVSFFHPMFFPGCPRDELSNRELWDDKTRSAVVDNYVHNFAQELRNGNLQGTEVIAQNLSCPHLGSKLSEALFKEDIHIAMLDFLGQCKGHLSVALKGAVGERADIPSLWMDILTLMVDYECPRDTRLMIAKRLEPLVMCMIKDRRQLFRSNRGWHRCLKSYFYLMYYLMCQSEEAGEIIISYDGFLPFVARASCWGVSRGDIIKEATWLQLNDSFAAACRVAQRVICLVVEEYDIEDKGDKDVKNDLLELIACTPLSNDAGCKDSTMVGFVRSMRREKKGGDLSSYLSVIVETLLLTGDYVDKRVIEELIEYGRDDSSLDSAEYVLGLVLGILGVYCDYNIRPSDCRYAVTISCGFLEFCVQYLASRIEMEMPIAPLKYFFETLSSMALHSKTSRVLTSEKMAQIHLSLDVLNNRNGTALPILDFVDPDGISTCCNCLKKCAKKNLHFCNCCRVEQYCSLSCQTESWNMGHSRLCKKLAKESNYLRSQGVSEADIKRMTTLKSNLMVSGCSFARSNVNEFLDPMLSNAENVKAGYSTTISVDFGEVPQTIETILRPSNGEEYPCSLRFEFVSPVWYGFAERLGLDSVRLEKYICIPGLDEDRTKM